MDRTRDAVESADLVIEVFDLEQGSLDTASAFGGLPCVRVGARADRVHATPPATDGDPLPTSARKGWGLDALRDRLLEAVAPRPPRRRRPRSA